MEAVPAEPVPESPAEAVALAPTVTVAFLTPAEVGVKTMISVQVEPDGKDSLILQVPPVRANSGSLKVAIGLPSVAVAVPLLVTVRVIGELLEPTFTEPKDGGELIESPGVGGAVPKLIAPEVQGPVAGRGLPFLSEFRAVMPSEVRLAPRFIAGELTFSVPSLFTKPVEAL